MKVGAERTRQIVLSLRNFSRLDEAEAHPVDLHDCLDSTLLILNNRIKKGVNIIRDYGEIPPIEGYMSSLYQVFMNLLSNALDAINEQPKPEIKITTLKKDVDWVEIRIADNGSGISRENQAKIFDTFFTTKPIGIGTGLGLAISRKIVEEKHHGKLYFKSELDRGTEFIIELPIQDKNYIS
jgi:signal transduction histidine kinase